MKVDLFKCFGCILSFAIMIVSCGGTELVHHQFDEAYQDKPVSDILVIAITGNENTRRIYENKFVAQLKAVGVDAISSKKAIPMPADLELKKETILEAVGHHENDAVIITHLIGKDQEEVYTRGGSRQANLYGFYRTRYSSADKQGYLSTSTAVRLETNLYDVNTEKLIWSGQTKTTSSDSKGRMIDDIIRAVIDNLLENKLIAPK